MHLAGRPVADGVTTPGGSSPSKGTGGGLGRVETWARSGWEEMRSSSAPTGRGHWAQDAWFPAPGRPARVSQCERLASRPPPVLGGAQQVRMPRRLFPSVHCLCLRNSSVLWVCLVSHTWLVLDGRTARFPPGPFRPHTHHPPQGPHATSPWPLTELIAGIDHLLP